MKKCYRSHLTIYLSPDGCDCNHGTSRKFPKRTFDAALRSVRKAKTAEIKLEAGSYDWTKLQLPGPAKLKVTGEIKLVKTLKVDSLRTDVFTTVLGVSSTEGIQIGDFVDLVDQVTADSEGVPVISLTPTTITVPFFNSQEFEKINILRPQVTLRLPSKPARINSCQTSVNWCGIKLEGFLENSIGSQMFLQFCDWSFVLSKISNFSQISISNSALAISSCVLQNVSLSSGPESNLSNAAGQINMVSCLIIDQFFINMLFGSLQITTCHFVPGSSLSQSISTLESSLVLANVGNFPEIVISNCRLFTFNLYFSPGSSLILRNTNWSHEGNLLILSPLGVPITAISSQIQLTGGKWELEGSGHGIVLIGSKLVGLFQEGFTNEIEIAISELGSRIKCDCSEICGNIIYQTVGGPLSTVSFELSNNSHVSVVRGSIDNFDPSIVALLFTTIGSKNYPDPGKYFEDKVVDGDGSGSGDLSSFYLSENSPVSVKLFDRFSQVSKSAE